MGPFAGEIRWAVAPDYARRPPYPGRSIPPTRWASAGCCGGNRRCARSSMTNPACEPVRRYSAISAVLRYVGLSVVEWQL